MNTLLFIESLIPLDEVETLPGDFFDWFTTRNIGDKTEYRYKGNIQGLKKASGMFDTKGKVATIETFEAETGFADSGGLNRALYFLEKAAKDDFKCKLMLLGSGAYPEAKFWIAMGYVDGAKEL